MKPVLLLVLACFAAGALAQARVPPEAKRGRLTTLMFPQVQIDGQLRQLAPGAKIFALNNLIVLPATVPPQTEVFYLLDGLGNVATVWLAPPRPSPLDINESGRTPVAPEQ